MEIKKILVTGSAGLIGTQVVKDLLKNNFEVYSCYHNTKPKLGRPIQLDLSKKKDIINIITKIEPNVIIHLAAITDVELCESKSELAKKINTDSTEILAKEAEKNNIFLMYMSTDYVFDGKIGMKKEEDEPNPINVYGKTKLDGEKMLKKISTPNIIVRTSTPFGIHSIKMSFPFWIKKNIELKKDIEVIIDQYTSPTYVPDISKMIIEIVKKKITGIVHIAGSNRISRYEFALMIAKKMNNSGDIIKPVKMKYMNWNAQRPIDSSLDITKSEKILKIKPKQLEENIELLFN